METGIRSFQERLLICSGSGGWRGLGGHQIQEGASGLREHLIKQGKQGDVQGKQGGPGRDQAVEEKDRARQQSNLGSQWLFSLKAIQLNPFSFPNVTS